MLNNNEARLSLLPAEMSCTLSYVVLWNRWDKHKQDNVTEWKELEFQPMTSENSSLFTWQKVG